MMEVTLRSVQNMDGTNSESHGLWGKGIILSSCYILSFGHVYSPSTTYLLLSEPTTMASVQTPRPTSSSTGDLRLLTDSPVKTSWGKLWLAQLVLPPPPWVEYL